MDSSEAETECSCSSSKYKYESCAHVLLGDLSITKAAKLGN